MLSDNIFKDALIGEEEDKGRDATRVYMGKLHENIQFFFETLVQ